MYINSLHIDKYKVLEDLKIDFQIPEDSKLENGNIVNVIAGINGSGKTSLLEWIFGYLGNHIKISKNGNQIHYAHELITTGSLNINDNDLNSTISQNNFKEFTEKVVQNKFTNNQKVIFFDSNTIRNENIITSGKHPFEEQKFINFMDSQHILKASENFISKYILNQERISRESDPKKRTKSVVKEFNTIFSSTPLLSKLETLNTDLKPIFRTLNNQLIGIEQLSSGEKQLYGRAIILKMLNPQNSVILIDEPEVSLHPQWQSEILNIYQNIGRNNQFIVTTHSPSIIINTNYKNLMFLKKEGNSIAIEEFKNRTQSPHKDINTFLKTEMGSEYLPKKLIRLQNEYQKLFDKQQEDSPKGEKLKKEILEWDSPNSSFWQGIAFDRELRDFE